MGKAFSAQFEPRTEITTEIPSRCQCSSLAVSRAERDSAVDVMKSGASDIIQKPFGSGQVSERIRQALQGSGRRNHDACRALPRQRRVNPDTEIVLAIPGDRVRRRTRVTLAGNPAELTDSSLKVLLHLMIA